jgi:hypothetical protein
VLTDNIPADTGGLRMSKAMRAVVIAVAAASVLLAAFVCIRLASTWMSLRHDQAMVIRQPNPRASPSQVANETAQNIAPFATVTVSSSLQDEGRLGSGVADGVVDQRGWLAREEMGGAWIQLTWNAPAVITEIVLYDRPNRLENVLGGTLTFDDGSSVAVPALPPGGNPWRASFPPKPVHWVMFRIDRAEGRNTGLEEIMVFGRLNP